MGPLPDFKRRANTTFVKLRAALDDLDPLVHDSEPGAKKLRPLFARAAPVRPRRAPDDARPRARSSGATKTATASIELTSRSRHSATSPRARSRPTGRSHGASPDSQDALSGNTPGLADVRQYGPDLLGWFDDFTATPVSIDALGAVSRAGIQRQRVLGQPTSTGLFAGPARAPPAGLRRRHLDPPATTAARAPASASDDGSNPYKPRRLPLRSGRMMLPRLMRRVLARVLGSGFVRPAAVGRDRVRRQEGRRRASHGTRSRSTTRSGSSGRRRQGGQRGAGKIPRSGARRGRTRRADRAVHLTDAGLRRCATTRSAGRARSR